MSVADLEDILHAWLQIKDPFLPIATMPQISVRCGPTEEKPASVYSLIVLQDSGADNIRGSTWARGLG